MFTGYIDTKGNHIKDGIKNDLSRSVLLRSDKWEKNRNGGYERRTGTTTEYTMLKLGERPEKVADWVIYQTWWSDVPYKPYWRKKLLSYWLRFGDLFKRTKP